MNKKGIALISSLALVLSGINAYASDIVITKDANKVSIEAYVEKNASAFVKAVKDGYGADNFDYIYGLEEETSDDEGKVIFEFYMLDSKNTESADGKYNVIVKQNNGLEQTAEFWYASAGTRNQLETDLDTKTLTEIISDPNNETVLNAFGFAMDVYSQLGAGQTEVISKVNAEIPDIASAETGTVAESFNENAVVVAANTNLADAVLKEALISAGAVNADTDATMMAWVIKCVDENSPYADFETVEKQVKVAGILSEIIDARFSQLTGLFDTYKTELGLVGNATYNKYLASKSKDDINEDIATALDRAKPVNASGLISIIESCLPKSGENGGGGGGASSSGGGYTGGNSSSSGAPVIGTTEIPDPQKAPSVGKGAFGDMDKAKWAETAVGALHKKGIVSGDGYGNFRPNDSVTREEFVKMIIVAANMHSTSATCDFTDVESTSWAYSYIASAVNNGVVSGVSNTEFGFGQTLTRQDMAVICARVLAKVKSVSAIREDNTFIDEAEISDYAQTSVHNLYTAGMINGIGDGSFAPKAVATRAQAAQMIYNMFAE